METDHDRGAQGDLHGSMTAIRAAIDADTVSAFDNRGHDTNEIVKQTVTWCAEVSRTWSRRIKSLHDAHRDLYWISRRLYFISFSKSSSTVLKADEKLAWWFSMFHQYRLSTSSNRSSGGMIVAS